MDDKIVLTKKQKFAINALAIFFIFGGTLSLISVIFTILIGGKVHIDTSAVMLPLLGYYLLKKSYAAYAITKFIFLLNMAALIAFYPFFVIFKTVEFENITFRLTSIFVPLFLIALCYYIWQFLAKENIKNFFKQDNLPTVKPLFIKILCLCLIVSIIVCGASYYAFITYKNNAKNNKIEYVIHVVDDETNKTIRYYSIATEPIITPLDNAKVFGKKIQDPYISTRFGPNGKATLGLPASRAPVITIECQEYKQKKITLSKNEPKEHTVRLVKAK
ncbi:hypothetical protein AAEX28_11515 [Lentisphaerota bacterium WC36G]|nr:hypothetical protein LJT99_14350 [Lentisphaerae bacterium WC36]